ncbi:MAG: 9-O-acetylesterase, partial [Planctomycetes bacterium]|nr:9-O-acetylesterase [Planctomycetota bacterium]
MKLKTCVLLFLLCLSAHMACADVKVAAIFGSNMVLQRDADIPVWGWAEPGENICIQLGSGEEQKTVAGKDGSWKVVLPKQNGSEPVKLVVKGNNEVVFTDILLGEVWLCSGQSNMEFTVNRSNNFEEEAKAANYPTIRHIKIPKRPAALPEKDVAGTWEVCSPETVGKFTACGYFMARKLQQELKVPVGLINSSWGGTRIEPWTPPVGFEGVPALKGIYDRVLLADPGTKEHKEKLGAYAGEVREWLGKTDAFLKDGAGEVSPLSPYPSELLPITTGKSPHQQPTALYNGMIHGFVPLPIRGAIWYQGESNHGEGMMYKEKMKALVGGWRKLWGNDFPFYFVQIAPYSYGNEPATVVPIFWEAQEAASVEIPNCGMVVTNDVGNIKDIHPRNKQAVGLRLALLALKNTYGMKDILASGPKMKEMKVEGDKIRVVFDNAEGLTTRDGKAPDWFEIIGKGTGYVKADVVIDGDAVILSSPEVKEACAMRFAWSKLAEPNLINKAGIPAGAFRAGEVPTVDNLVLNVGESKDYALAYDLDLTELGRTVKYKVDNSKNLGAFDRIAYMLELTDAEGKEQYVYVSMDAFTDDARKIAIPTLDSKAFFNVPVKNMNIVSNVRSVKGGTGINGNIEFWPNNYAATNSMKIAGASDTTYDFGDAPSEPDDGYGSMQVHNTGAKQTVFAI